MNPNTQKFPEEFPIELIAFAKDAIIYEACRRWKEHPELEKEVKRLKESSNKSGDFSNATHRPWLFDSSDMNFYNGVGTGILTLHRRAKVVGVDDIEKSGLSIETRQNAELIETAVNSYDSMKETIRDQEKIIEECQEALIFLHKKVLDQTGIWLDYAEWKRMCHIKELISKLNKLTKQ